MNLSLPNFTASILLSVIHLVSLGILLIYVVQYLRVRRRRKVEFCDLGEDCVGEIGKPPILMWCYLIATLAVIVSTTIFFFFLLPSNTF